MIVSHAHRFIFLKTRKTAGTSIEIALSTVCGPEDVITPIMSEDEVLRERAGGRGPQNYESPPLVRKAYNHMPAQMVRRVFGRDIWSTYVTFAVERNPWDAVVSLYHWSHGGPDPMPFGEFVRSPQVVEFATKQARIYRIGGAVAVDRVCRYENLAMDVTRVWEELKLPGVPALPQAKSGSRATGRAYASYYDHETRARVAEVFAPVIDELGYTFEKPVQSNS